jgi:SAM-dependent methyltransferase
MFDYWESLFKNQGALWKFEPSNSAILAMDLFKSRGIRTILIPGFGYGRNAKVFCDNGFEVTGIEIAKSAIDIAISNAINCKLHHGSVTSMPFDDDLYDGIFCYALLHLLNKSERKAFLKSCYDQLRIGGFMFFVVASKQMDMYGSGKYLSNERYLIPNGLKVYFYDEESLRIEFSRFKVVVCDEIVEPIKYIDGNQTIRLLYIVVQK